MSDIDPTKPIPNDEKFKPQNVEGKGKAKPSRIVLPTLWPISLQ